MNDKNKWIVGIVILVVAVVLTVYFGSRASQGNTITLGVITPLSGDAASYGQTEQNMTNLAVDEINGAGGINGKKVSVIYEDGRCNGKDATNAIQKLVSVDKVKIILGGTCSAETLAVGPIAMASHAILFSSFSSNPAISKIGVYMFRNSPSDSDVGVLDANTMAAKFKKVALLSEDTDYSQGVRTIMKGVFQEKNISVVADEIYVGDTTDFRTMLTKMKQANPDALYINPGTSPKAGGLIVRQARQLSMTMPIYGNLYLGTPDALSAGGSYMNGVIISDSSPLSNKGSQLLAEYKQKFGADPANNFLMGAAYDRVYILKDALVAVGENTDKIKDFLHQMPSFSGALGTYHFNASGDVVGVGFINYTLQNGKEIPLVL